MSDLIKRNDAIKAVCEGCLSIWKTCQYHWDCPALTNLMKLPSADRPQEWTLCKEKLPKEYEVLCCDIYRNCIVGHPFVDDSVSTGFCAEGEGEFLYECVAWMPLPEPYGES